jgi:hypothetical protein
MDIGYGPEVANHIEKAQFAFYAWLKRANTYVEINHTDGWTNAAFLIGYFTALGYTENQAWDLTEEYFEQAYLDADGFIDRDIYDTK